MKMVITDGYPAIIDEQSVQLLQQVCSEISNGMTLDLYDITQPNDIVERCKDAEFVLTNKVVFSDEVMAQLPQLRYIGVLATGTNVVDIAAAQRRGITVTNIPAYSTASVAQLVMAHLLAAVHRVEHYSEENHAGRWAKSPVFIWMDHTSIELAGKQFGIVGFGNIGQAVARLALAFGMTVAVATSKTQDELPDGVIKMSQNELFRTSDVVSLHCPLTSQNRHFVNAALLSTMRPSAILINTGRGPLVSESDVAAALHAGKLGAYCTDVMEQEPPQADNPLFGAPRCFITPHLAWATVEARRRLLDICADNIRAFVAGKPQNVVLPA